MVEEVLGSVRVAIALHHASLIPHRVSLRMTLRVRLGATVVRARLIINLDTTSLMSSDLVLTNHKIVLMITFLLNLLHATL